ncbi:MAG: hypothetical protein RLZZ618_762, partial [Pseudomonadota bacterium]
PGVTMTATGVEYLSHPVAANGNALASNWLRPFADIYLADTCPSLVSPDTCLPAGTYTARFTFTKTKAGLTTTVYYPVTFNITD